MKIPKYLINHIYKMSDTARKLQIMNNELNTYLDKLGIDKDTEEFEDAFSYVEGDCYPNALIDYLRGL
jgi:hypothetical protein